MTTKDLEKLPWEEALEVLRTGRVPEELLHKAILRVGKTYDMDKLHTARHVIAQYLDHENPWVRHEAMFCLGVWGKLREFEPHIIRMMQDDPDPDNRGAAALCLGIMESGSKHAEGLKALARVALKATEEDTVRLTAYGAMLEVWHGGIERNWPYQMGDRTLQEVDWTWVRSFDTTAPR